LLRPLLARSLNLLTLGGALTGRQSAQGAIFAAT
jgi:hypothetical protein